MKQTETSFCTHRFTSLAPYAKCANGCGTTQSEYVFAKYDWSKEPVKIEFTPDEVFALQEALAKSPGVEMKLGNAYESALRKLNGDA